MRPGYHEVVWGFDPEKLDGTLRKYYLSVRDLQRCYKHARLKALNIAAALHVLRDPIRINRGIRPKSRRKWGYCYVGRPDQWYVTDGVLAPLPPFLLYCAFVDNQDVLYEWRAERAEDASKGLLQDRGVRFEEEIWTRTDRS